MWLLSIAVNKGQVYNYDSYKRMLPKNYDNVTLSINKAYTCQKPVKKYADKSVGVTLLFWLQFMAPGF